MLERQRWVTAMTPPIGGEIKQVIVKKKYVKQRPDELNLEIGDLINIIHDKGGNFLNSFLWGGLNLNTISQNGATADDSLTRKLDGFRPSTVLKSSQNISAK